MSDFIQENGKILCTRFSDFRGNTERIEYTWDGGPIIGISWDLLDEITDPVRLKFGQIGRILNIGPYRLKVIDSDPMRGEEIAIRVDYRLWWIVAGWHKASRMLDIVYRRTIITMAVWRLADYNPAVIPSWRDVGILRRLFVIEKRNKIK